MALQRFYEAQTDGLARRIGRLKGRAHGFVVGEIASFVAAVACVVLFTVTDNATSRLLELLAAALCAVAYVVIRQHDARNDARIQRLEDLKQVYDNELSALRGDFSCFDDGQRYVDPHHAYTYDLDVFGKNSLYQRMCRMATTGGCDALAERLASLDGSGTHGSTQPLATAFGKDYQARVEALAGDEAFRAAFIAHGVRERIDTAAIRQALRAAGEVRVARWFAHPLALVVAMADLIGFFACIVLAAMGRVNSLLPVWWAVAQFFGVYLLCMGPLRAVGKAIDRLHGQVTRLASVARLMDNDRADVFRRLTELLDGLDKRGNIMGLFVVDALVLYDFFLVRKFIKWTRHDRREFDEWIDRIVQKDLDVTIATFRHNHPATCWAEITDGAGVDYAAKGLYHPFLGEKAVRNDFHIDDRHFYIITGANMAGKSTFLRSIGVNYILAMLGMPVFATSMRVSRFRLFSSMRTTDDLAHGISYFNAELLRLQLLLAYCAGKGGTLIILDEILKGTNSLDKLNGSRLFLEHIAHLPVSGVVATHDLELSKMEGPRYHNYCFEIELGATVTYSYKITPGVARNQNATFLLRQMLDGK